MFPALIQMLLQQVVSVDVLRLPGALHGLLVHFQAHRWYKVSSKAAINIILVFVSIILRQSCKTTDTVQEKHFDI